MVVSKFQEEMNLITDEVITTFGKLSATQQNYKSNADTWSIAQNIEHLIRVNDSYLPTLKKIKSNTHKTPFMGRIKWWANMCGKFILKSVDPARTKKIKTFPVWQPAISDSSDTLMEDFKQNQKVLIDEVLQNENAINQGVVVGSPANANITYPMSTALEIIVDHAKRHINQAKDLLPLVENIDAT